MQSKELLQLKYCHDLKYMQRLQTSDVITSSDYNIHFNACIRFVSANMYIASCKYTEFENVFRSAQYALKKAIEGKNDYEEDRELNVYPEKEFLKNAILWYNACYDHILQVIYFAFDFNEPIVSQKTYKKALVKCRFIPNTPFYNDFEQAANRNTHAKRLFNKLTEFFRRAPLNSWANKLKHTGDFWFGMNVPCIELFQIEFKKRGIVFSTSYIDGTTPSREEVIEELIRQNNRIVIFVDYLYKFIGFEKLHNKRHDCAFCIKDSKIKRKFSSKLKRGGKVTQFADLMPHNLYYTRSGNRLSTTVLVTGF